MSGGIFYIMVLCVGIVEKQKTGDKRIDSEKVIELYLQWVCFIICEWL